MSFDRNWASVIAPTLVYVGIVHRADFDKLALPQSDQGVDGEKKLLTKRMEGDGMTVIFQHWYGPTPAVQAANEAVENARRGAAAGAHA